MEKWRGKTAVVTGAGGGIGRAIADHLAVAGLKVVGLDINPEKSVTAILSEISSVDIVYCKCDVTNLSELASTFHWIEETYGGVDLMVNSAGYARMGHITSVGPNPLSDEDILKILDVNIKGTIFCSRHAVDSMRRRGFDGHIVNINSIAGHYVAFTERFNVYSSSKYAVTAFTQSLAVELATFKNNIKTTSISPGLVQTAMTSQHQDFGAGVSALQPTDVAEAVIYAISTPPHVDITELTVQPVGELRL